MTDTQTLATPANMRAFEKANPGLDDRRCFAYSPTTGEQYSATPGDYWQHTDDEPLTDSAGEPMVLVVAEMRYLDVLTKEVV